MADEPTREKISIAQGGDVRPIPDPTELTDKLVRQAVGALRETLDARLNGMDQRFVQLHAEFDRLPAEIEKGVSNLRTWHEEKFVSIQTQFKERDTRTEQSSKDSKVAVDAALQAAKEAVSEQNKASATAIAKSEAATTKQIDQLGVLIQNSNAALNDKIDDLKARIALIEGRGNGTNAAWGYAIGAIGIVAAVIGIVTAIVSNASHFVK